MGAVNDVSVSELPSEIVHSEILPRLPAKSLMRFKCVSKTWSSLFRNPSFITAHRNFQQCPNKEMTTVMLVVRDRSGPHQHLLSAQISHHASTSNDPSQAVATYLKLSAPAQRIVLDSYKVQRTSGLISVHSRDQSQRDHARTIRVLNPSTGDSITIPLPSPPTGRIVCVSHHFGFCHVTNEYKILLVQRYSDERDRRMIVFKIFTLAMGSSNSGTSSWRALEIDNDGALPPNYYLADRSVCVQGALHWVDRARPTRSDELVRTIVVAFDLREEKFRSIILPSDYITDEYPYIIELHGCVGVAYVMYRTQTLEMRILKDYKNREWVKETTSFPVHWGNVMEPLDTGGDVLLLKVSNMAKGIRVHFYNRKTKNFETCEIILPGSIIGDDSARALQAFFSYESCIVPLN